MLLDILLEDIDYCLKTRVLWLPTLFLSSIAIIEYLYDTGSSAGCLERRSRVIGVIGANHMGVADGAQSAGEHHLLHHIKHLRKITRVSLHYLNLVLNILHAVAVDGDVKQDNLFSSLRQ